ncbi:MAG: hypothetical protein J5517_05615 [Eubacterium sp.]|nr:hypothetical protein [Eubacterium sp.]
MSKFKKNVEESMLPGETIKQYQERQVADHNMIFDVNDDDIVDAISNLSYEATIDGNKVTIDNDQLFQGVSMAAQRTPTQLSLFRIWLMGEKNIPAEKAFSFNTKDDNCAEYLKEYSKFLYDNRVSHVNGLPDLKQSEIEEHAVNHYKIFKKATENLKKFKFPDIDYTDSKQFEKHKAFLFNFGGMGVDFGQEVANFTKNVPNAPKYAKKVFGSNAEYGRMMDTWQDISAFGRTFNNAFKADQFDMAQKNETAAYIGASVRRYFLKKQSDEIRGKTFAEFIAEKSKNPIKDFAFEKDIMNMKTSFENDIESDQMLKDYLSGKNNDFEAEFEKRLPKIHKKTMLEVNDILKESANNFLVGFTVRTDARKAFPEFLKGDPSPEEKLKRLKETKGGKNIESSINYLFYKLEESVDGSMKLLNAAGKDGLDRLRIDGMSPREIWGDKYASVKDPGDRDLLIKSEVLEEMFFGTKKVTAENYVVTNENKIAKAGEFQLTYSQDEIQKYQSFIAEVDELHQGFEKVQKLFQKYQKNKNANFEPNAGKEGSIHYRKMIKALNDCIEVTDLNHNHSKEELFKAIQSYQMAAENYYNERKGSITGPLTSKGKIRLGLAEDAMNNLMQRFDTLNILSKGLDLDASKYDKESRYSIKNFALRISNSESMKDRKIGSKDFKYDNVKKQPFYSENVKAYKKAVKRNKDYNKSPIYKQIKEQYPRNYMRMWCKAQDGAEEINKQRKSVNEMNGRRSSVSSKSNEKNISKGKPHVNIV